MVNSSLHTGNGCNNFNCRHLVHAFLDMAVTSVVPDSYTYGLYVHIKLMYTLTSQVGAQRDLPIVALATGHDHPQFIVKRKIDRLTIPFDWFTDTIKAFGENNTRPTWYVVGFSRLFEIQIRRSR